MPFCVQFVSSWLFDDWVFYIFWTVYIILELNLQADVLGITCLKMDQEYKKKCFLLIKMDLFAIHSLIQSLNGFILCWDCEIFFFYVKCTLLQESTVFLQSSTALLDDHPDPPIIRLWHAAVQISWPKCGRPCQHAGQCLQEDHTWKETG